jgi:cell division protein FtsA
MEESIVVGIDIGTTKICTLVARVEGSHRLRILGVGIEPSAGIRKGGITDINSASQAISRSIEKAQRTSGLEINSALVSLAGSHVTSFNSRGVVGISHGVIETGDFTRAVEAARAIAIPHNQEVIHVIQRGFTVDGQEGIKMPVGMHGYRLEVEAHIITAAAGTVENIRKCVEQAGVTVSQFVLNPLAAGEAVLSENERQMGAAVCDIGSGTTDMAIYIDGDVWHTIVIPIGGDLITSDIAHGLRLPLSQAEMVKRQHGVASQKLVKADEMVTVRSFNREEPARVSRSDLAHIIEARVEEIFELIVQEIKRSGYDGLLPAGLVLTGGTSNLPEIARVASEVTGLSARTAKPENLVGLVDQLHSSAYSTSIGLLQWAVMMNETIVPGIVYSDREFVANSRFSSVMNWVRRLLP